MPIDRNAMRIFCKYLKFNFYKKYKSNIEIQNHILNRDKQKIFFQGKALMLTKKEFNFLQYIFINSNTIISYLTLDELFWSNSDNTSARRSFLCRLRQKAPFLTISIKRDIGLGIFENKFL